MSQAVKSIQEKIDNYSQTIIAIVGFMNFYRYDSKKEPIKLFQGRRLVPSTSDGDEYVTPDIGILLPGNSGVLGEVKHTFPRNTEHWQNIFDQLLKYDDNLREWPNEDGTVTKQDVVLLTHQSRARAVKNYYRTKQAKGEIEFTNQFSIVEYNRTTERQEFFFFRIEEGQLDDETVNHKLQDGVQVPMSVFLINYATIKLYDDKPELPYLMHLIWTNVVLDRASEDERYSRLAKNRKLDVQFNIDEIIEVLRTSFSFMSLNTENSDRQPQIPKTAWVKEACYKFVEWNEAKWGDDQRTIIIFHCHKKYSDILKFFIEKYVGEGDSDQPTLFDLEDTAN